jgi:predicted RNase H-like HicB family nuclease
MPFKPLEVVATWDSDAGVWVAESEQIPGLVTEAATPEELLAKLGEIIPALLEENDDRRPLQDLPYSMSWQKTELVHLKRA